MIYDRNEPDISNGFQSASATLIASSHLRLIRRELLPLAREIDPGRALYEAPMVVLAHDVSPDPVFFYANRAAQQLFEMSWHDLVHLPSRHSAEPLDREERQRLLDRVSRQGYIDDYSGVRVSKTGKRFLIERAIVWNLLNPEGRIVGQAAAFDSWVSPD